MKDKDFAKVYERNYKRSFLFAKSYVHDDLVAEDIAAESLFKYWQICRESEENVSEAMLVTILKNRAIDHLRAEMHKQIALESMAETAMRDLEIQVTALEACDPNELFFGRNPADYPADFKNVARTNTGNLLVKPI